jgi:hypothetical protein
MVAQPFPVVRRHDDQGSVVDAEALQEAEEIADDRVGGGDLPVVRERVARAVGLRRIVGHVGLVEVEEEEEPRVLLRLHPFPGQRLRRGAGPLEVGEGRPGPRVDRVLVRIERGGETGLAAEHVGRHGRRRGIPLLLQDRRQARVVGAPEGEADVVPHAVLGGLQPREQGDVGREGHGTRAVGMPEQDRFAPQAVEVRRLDTAVAVGGQMIGAQRVDGDDDDGRPGKARRGRLVPACEGGHAKPEKRRTGHRLILFGT